MKQWILAAVLGLVLVACGGGTSTPPTPSELAELITGGDQAEAQVTLEVLRSFKPATISTQFNPFIGGLTVYEISGTTPKGLPFKAIALGDEGLEPDALRGQLRMKARLRRIQGQVVLAGWLVPRDPNSTLNPIAFIAAAQNANFRGPTAGTVYQFSGMAEFRGVCEEKGLSGSYSLKQGNLELVGALKGVRAGETLGCTPGEVQEQNLPVALSYTAVETHMGTIFSFQGSLAPGAGGASAQGQVQSAMPSQGLTLTPPTLPISPLVANVALKPNVKELGNASGAELVSFDQDNGTLIFNRLAGNLRELAVGDIVASAPRNAASNGFLRRVTGIENTSDGKVRVRTAKANVADLLDESDIQMDLPLSEADVQRATALERGQIIYAAQQLGPSAQSQIRKEFSEEVIEGVTVSGFVQFTPKIVVKFQCRKAFCSEPYFLAKFVLNERAEVRLNAILEKTLHKSIPIARVPLGTITAGPLVFVIDVVFTVDVEGKLRVELEVGAWQELEIEAGTEYNKDFNGRFQKINEITKNERGIIGPTIEGSAELKAGVYGALRLMLYGVAGVSAEAGPYVQFNAQYPRQPYWTMKFGLEGNLGVDIDLLIFRKEWDVNLFDIELFTEQAPNSPPKFDDIGPKYGCNSGYAARNASNKVVLSASTDDKEDGPGTGTIQWRRGNNLLGTTTKADKHTLEVDLPNGTHTLTATLTDSQGTSRTRSFEVKLAANQCQFPNGLPDVNIVGNSDEGLPIPFPYYANLTARTWPFSQAGCPTHEVFWRSNLQRRSLGSTNGVFVPASGGVGPFCEHSFEVRKMADRQVITTRFTLNDLTVKDTTEVLPSRILSLNIGGIQYSAPSNSRYIYVGDQVNFTVSGDNPVWSSSEPADNINGRSGNSVNARLNTPGPRTIVAQVSDGNGGFNSKSRIIYVHSGLARP
ncbi:hypothetical protein [Meiothermus sp.]|uniref:hypothetical protein n=1 Tax=Meiothermus sp. TaxID=1955249 RepID=UPI00307FA97B